MKSRILLTFLLAFFIQFCFCQSPFDCGTKNAIKLDSTGKSVIVSKVYGDIRDINNFPVRRFCKNAKIQVVFHVILDDNGNGGFNTSTTIHTDILQILNQNFSSHNITFQLKPQNQNIDYISNNNFFNLVDHCNPLAPPSCVALSGDGNDDGKFDNLTINSSMDAIDIYLLGNGNFGSILGVAANVGATSIVFVGSTSATIADISMHTICHEMGHCLGLQHTFYHTNCDEQSPGIGIALSEGGGMVLGVYQSNGYQAGDFVFDTYADPSKYPPAVISSDCHENGLNYDWTCGTMPNSNFDQDRYGFIWNPLANNQMDYNVVAATGCALEFTPLQWERMYATLANDIHVNQTIVKETATVNVLPVSPINICSGNSVNLTAISSPDFYYYDWTPVNQTGNTITVNPLITTEYTVTASSKCMSPVTKTVQVIVDDGLNFEIVGNDVLCENDQFNYTVNNLGTTFITGTWSVISGNGSINPNNGLLTVGAGVSSVTITFSVLANNGCTHTVSKIINIIPQNASVVISASPDQVCDGVNDVLLSVNAIPGLTYTWNTIPVQTGNSIIVTPTNANHIYIVSAISPCGNTITDTKVITVNLLPTVSISPLSQPLCIGNTVPIMFSSNPVYPQFATIFWSSGDGSINDQQAPAITFTAATPGNNATIQADIVDNNTGCTNTIISNPFTVLPNQAAITSSFTSICVGQNLQFTANAPGGTWSITSSSAPNVAFIDPLTGILTAFASGNFYVTYTVDLCTNQSSVATQHVTVNITPEITHFSNLLTSCTPPFNHQFFANVPGTWSIVGNTIAATIDLLSGMLTVVPNTSGVFNIKFTPTTPNSCITDPITVTVKVIDCSLTTCENVTTSTSIPGGIVTSLPPSSNSLYNIDRDITIDGAVTFSNVQVRVASGVSITLNHNATLNVYGSHFYSCQGNTWKGFDASANDTKIIIANSGPVSSMIEDAEVAVKYSNQTPIPSSADKIINIQSTIFNRNRESIEIEGIVTQNFTPVLPINISNCIFTCRNIYFDPTIAVWDNVKAVRASANTINIPFGSTPVTYFSPYIENSRYSDMSVNAYLPDGSKPNAAIVIKNAGNKMSIAGDLQTLVLGGGVSLQGIDLESNTIVIDNHNIGILIDNSNVTVNNVTIQKPNPDYNNPINTTAIGIEVDNNSQNIVNITTPSNSPKNAFFDLNTAIFASQGIREMTVNDCDIRSGQDVANLNALGSFGINIGLDEYRTVNINRNSIYNIQNGIWFSAGGRDLRSSRLNVNDNILSSSALTSVIPGGTGITTYMQHAINLESRVPFVALPPAAMVAGTLNCKNNEVMSAANGIGVRGWQYGTTITSNKITLAQDAGPNPLTEQSALSVEGCSGTESMPIIIQENQLTGYDMNQNTIGMNVALTSYTNIGCNQVGGYYDNNYITTTGFQHGFKFVGNNPNTKFWDNTMYTTNMNGLTLSQGGIIGKQGDEIGSPICTSNNSWEQPGTAWNGLQDQFMTLCESSDPTNSPFVYLHKQNGSNLELQPTKNTSDNLGNSTTIYGTPGSLIPSTTTSSSCQRCASSLGYRMKSLLQEIADGTISLPNDDANERLLVMQEQLYELLKANPTLVLNDTTLQQFIYDNQWTNLDFIHYASRYVAEGKWDLVQILLGAWPGQSKLDMAYQDYFKWLKEMHNAPEWHPDLADVEKLANQCPVKYGTVVFAVRNLFNAITGKINEFKDNCEGNAGARGMQQNKGFIRLKNKKRSTQPITQQDKNSLLVYPNPTTGMLNVEYKTIKQVFIVDVTGRAILNKSWTGSTNQVQLDLSNLPRGVFIIKAINAENNVQTQKFIKSK